jgi:hypothetical protein
MVDRALYKEKFEPIVQPNEFIQTFPKVKYYVVKAIYALPLLVVDLIDADHLGAAVDITTTESAEVEIKDIYLDDLELAQLRVVPIEDFFISYIGKPKQRPYMTTKNKVWQIPALQDDARLNPANEYLHLNEIFQFEDTDMWIKVTSHSATISTTGRLAFFGYRFILKEIGEADIPKGIKPTVIPTEGYPGTSE